MSDLLALEAIHLKKEVNTNRGTLTILNDLSFSIPVAQTVAIVGVSGSGKSTLLSLLAGLDEPSSGSVRLMGEALFALNEDGRAKLRGQTMGFIFQSFQLLGSMNALENVMVPLELKGIRGAEQKAKSLLNRVGLSDRLYHYPRQLSGGEQQRVAIARAFATTPKILLADEPTGNLDAQTAKQITDLMFELNQEHQTTLVLVTHDEALSQRCHQVLRLAAGQLVHEGHLSS
ncbi:MAG: ABC transporter ATP-binding protein [Betaproteobacteria bacterium]